MTASLARNQKGKAGAGRFPTFPASGIARISNLVSPAGVHSASEHASTGLALIWVARGQSLHPGVISSAGQPRGRAVSARTVEAWKARRRMPSAPQIMALLSDDTLCALLLEEVNPALARQAKIIEAKKKLQELEEG